jgi:5-(carboxyamino)imidazole ribonucleotide synthase
MLAAEDARVGARSTAFRRKQTDDVLAVIHARSAFVDHRRHPRRRATGAHAGAVRRAAGLRFLVLDSVADACAGQFAPMVVGDYRDEAALANSPAASTAPPSISRTCRRKARNGWLSACRCFRARGAGRGAGPAGGEDPVPRLGIDTPLFADVPTRAALDAALDLIGARPAILKTRRLGYDGKGQFRIRTRADADAAWGALGAQAEHGGLILEGFVAFQRELSVVAVRGRDGEFRAWPITENWHEAGVLSASLAPARVDAGAGRRALDMRAQAGRCARLRRRVRARTVRRDGELLANEMAPRVHNSGHWTIEGSETSQFQNHLRAVLGLPLGSTAARGVSCMLNWIGTMPDAVPRC